MAGLFITATGTDIGKTYILRTLIAQAQSKGIKVHAIKPIISGFDKEKVAESDTGLILRALGKKISSHSINMISPWRYMAPLSPDMAATLENTSIPFEELVLFSQKRTLNTTEICLIEGVGGIMVPLNEKKTTLDWIKACALPVLLVSGTYLGALSHIITAYQILKINKIRVKGIILNESKEKNIGIKKTIESLKNFIGNTPITSLEYHKKQESNRKEDFSQFPDLTGYLS